MYLEQRCTVSEVKERDWVHPFCTSTNIQQAGFSIKCTFTWHKSRCRHFIPVPCVSARLGTQTLSKISATSSRIMFSAQRLLQFDIRYFHLAHIRLGSPDYFGGGCVQHADTIGTQPAFSHDQSGAQSDNMCSHIHEAHNARPLIYLRGKYISYLYSTKTQTSLCHLSNEPCARFTHSHLANTNASCSHRRSALNILRLNLHVLAYNP